MSLPQRLRVARQVNIARCCRASCLDAAVELDQEANGLFNQDAVPGSVFSLGSEAP